MGERERDREREGGIGRERERNEGTCLFQRLREPERSLRLANKVTTAVDDMNWNVLEHRTLIQELATTDKASIAHEDHLHQRKRKNLAWVGDTLLDGRRVGESLGYRELVRHKSCRCCELHGFVATGQPLEIRSEEVCLFPLPILSSKTRACVNQNETRQSANNNSSNNNAARM